MALLSYFDAEKKITIKTTSWQNAIHRKTKMMTIKVILKNRRMIVLREVFHLYLFLIKFKQDMALKWLENMIK